jgi:hypothetical protein
MAFSKLKAHLRKIGARNFTAMFNAIAEFCDLYSTDACRTTSPLSASSCAALGRGPGNGKSVPYLPC